MRGYRRADSERALKRLALAMELAEKSTNEMPMSDVKGAISDLLEVFKRFKVGLLLYSFAHMQ